MKKVESFTQLLAEITNKEKSFLLLYKKGGEISDCAYRNLEKASKTLSGLNLYDADVTKVRDIHSTYGITSVPTLIEFSNHKVRNLYKGCSEVNVYKNLFEESIYFQEAKDQQTSQKSVTIYTSPTCTWCNALKSYLRQHRVTFTDIDISRDQQAAEQLVRRSGQMGVPQTEIDGEIIVGFNKARISELLALKG